MNNRQSITRRDVIRASGAIAAVPFLAACTVLDARDDDRYTVEMTDRARYEPSGITVPVGATIVWRNMDENPHTVTTDPDALGDPNRVRLPDGAEPWDSGEILTGERWEHTFTVPGTYVYACQYHQDHGMVGTVTVEDE